MQVSKIIFGLFSAALVLSACNNVDFKKTKAGVPFKIYGENKGDSIKLNYIVKFDVIQKTKDTVLFSSYQQGMPQYMQVQQVPPTFSYNDVGANLMEIFLHAKKGDSIYITQATDSLLKQNPDMSKSNIKKGDQMITTLKIVEVYKSPEEAQAAVNKDRFANYDKNEATNLERFKADTAAQAQIVKDNKLIEDHLAANNIQTQKTTWGVYIQVLNPGQGPKPKPGQYVTVKYKGTNFKGEEFDSGVYPMQVGTGGSIKGFEEGVMQLSKGGKAKVFVPSTLAYGARGSAPKIQPNENLIFELELTEISDNRPAQDQHSPDDGHGR